MTWIYIIFVSFIVCFVVAAFVQLWENLFRKRKPLPKPKDQKFYDDLWWRV